MLPIPEEITTLISDLESFLSDGLRGENLGKKAKERKVAFIKRIKDIKASYPQDFKDKRDIEEWDEEDEVDSNNDAGSLHSERTDKDEGGSLHSERTDKEDGGSSDGAPVAAQDLPMVFKAGYLEKRRKDHSFFGPEWQKRWCALSNRTFYYYGSEKDKQQRGDFCIDGYMVKMNGSLRKDAKKDCCFEISAPDKRVYQFTAASQNDADDWVEKIGFVLKDMVSEVIPEEEQYDDVGVPQHLHPQPVTSSHPAPIDDDIYEELPEEDLPAPPPKAVVETPSKPAPPAAAVVNKSTDYKNYYQGKWDCSADHPDELSFKRGDAIYILSKEYQNFGWWVGEMKGAIGIVPKDYLMELYAI